MFDDRPWIEYGRYVLTSDKKRQWIVGIPADDLSPDMSISEALPNQDRTYHTSLESALDRMMDRKLRNMSINSMEELRDAIQGIRGDIDQLVREATE